MKNASPARATRATRATRPKVKASRTSCSSCTMGKPDIDGCGLVEKHQRNLLTAPAKQGNLAFLTVSMRQFFVEKATNVKYFTS